MNIYQRIQDLILEIQPFDEKEQKAKRFALQWLQGTKQIFRIEKPDKPSIHLVSYFMLFNEESFLLMLHRKAKLWIPGGGHVEIDEHPHNAAARECVEELGITPEFIHNDPLFITLNEISRPIGNHTDVCLWYALKNAKDQAITPDLSEFTEVKWFTKETLPLEACESDLERFLNKTLCTKGNNSLCIDKDSGYFAV